MVVSLGGRRLTHLGPEGPKAHCGWGQAEDSGSPCLASCDARSLGRQQDGFGFQAERTLRAVSVPPLQAVVDGKSAVRTENGECSLCFRIIQTQAGCVSLVDACVLGCFCENSAVFPSASVPLPLMF